MLKIFHQLHYVSINGHPYKRLDAESAHILEESNVTTEQPIFNNLSFNECFELLKKDAKAGMYCDRTPFLNKPVINICYANEWVASEYTHFDTISYKVIYANRDNNYTLADIMNRFPADQAINYLKERGIATCPMFIK